MFDNNFEVLILTHQIAQSIVLTRAVIVARLVPSLNNARSIFTIERNDLKFVFYTAGLERRFNLLVWSNSLQKADLKE